MNDETIEEKLEEFKDSLTKMSKITIAKGITKMIVRHSASAVVVTVVHTLVPKDVLNRNRKAQLYIAAWALGGVASDGAADWAAENVGGKLEFAKTIVAAIKGDSKNESDSPEESAVAEETPTE